MKNTLLLCLAAGLLSGAFATPVAVPGEINYQGRLTDQRGNPVNDVRLVTLRIFDAAIGGEEIYRQDIGGVEFVDGLYSFTFGGAGAGLAGVLTGPDNYLELEIGGEKQSARTKLLAVPFAMRSADAQVLAAKVAEMDGALQALAVGGNQFQELATKVGELDSALQTLSNSLGQIPVTEALSSNLLDFADGFGLANSSPMQARALGENLQNIFTAQRVLEFEKRVALRDDSEDWEWRPAGNLSFLPAIVGVDYDEDYIKEEFFVRNSGFRPVIIQGVTVPQGFQATFGIHYLWDSGEAGSLAGGTLPLSLRPGELLKVRVAFRPTEAKVHQGLLRILSDANISPGTVGLRGEGVAPGNPLVHFGYSRWEEWTGELELYPYMESFSVTNYGDADLVIDDVQFTDSRLLVGLDQPLTVPAGESRGIPFSYDGIAGEISGTVTLQSNLPAGLRSFPFTGSVSPVLLTGWVSISEWNPNSFFTITNRGYASTITITSIESTLPGVEVEFAGTISLPPGEEQRIEVSMANDEESTSPPRSRYGFIRVQTSVGQFEIPVQIYR
jgi:hypothetical protein